MFNETTSIAKSLNIKFDDKMVISFQGLGHLIKNRMNARKKITYQTILRVFILL